MLGILKTVFSFHLWILSSTLAVASKFVLVMLVLALIPVLYEKMPYRKYGLIYSSLFPFIAGCCLLEDLVLRTTRINLVTMLTLILEQFKFIFSSYWYYLGPGAIKMPVLRILCTIHRIYSRSSTYYAAFCVSTMLNYFLPRDSF